jgi:hypothetical protein
MKRPHIPEQNTSAKITSVVVAFEDGSRRTLDVSTEEAEELRRKGRIPPEGSDISGAEFGQDEKERIIVTLGNGTRRRIVVRAEEARQLEGRGHPLDSVSAGIVTRYAKIPKSLRVAMATLFLSALLVPAISRQFTDRQQEAEFKSRVRGQIQQSSINAIQQFQSTARHFLPELYAADQDCEAYRIQKTSANKELCEKSEREGQRVGIAAIVNAQARWNLDRSLIRNDLNSFSDEQLVAKWDKHAAAIVALSRILPGTCKDHRERQLGYLREYLPEQDRDDYKGMWEDLSTKKPCRKGGIDAFSQPGVFSGGTPKYNQAYILLASRLTDKSNDMANALVSAHSPRYSVGLWDFVRDVVTPLRRY